MRYDDLLKRKWVQMKCAGARKLMGADEVRSRAKSNECGCGSVYGKITIAMGRGVFICSY